jgi:hypothetical protein
VKIVVKILPLRIGERPLGRHVEHDPRSRAYSAGTAAIKTVRFKRHGRVLNQLQLNSCTGNAMAGVLMTEPFWKKGRTLTEDDAVELYEVATRRDHIRGVYPPDDDGSTGLGVMKAAVDAGFITGYAHAFGLEHLLGSLTLRPGILGVNWYDSFDTPAADGECRLPRKWRRPGGHEIEMFGIDARRKRVWCYNSWGSSWGKNGTFYFSWKTLDRLLHEEGDAAFPRVM